MTEACVRSVLEHTQFPYEIILIDDASDPETAARMKAMKNERIRHIRNEERRSFSASNNQAARLARGKYLCLLNNDTYVTPGWLSAMIKTAEKNERIGALGNKHLFPDTGLLHHCGIAIDSDGHPYHLHPHTDPEALAVNYQRDPQIVTFACVLIPAETYRELGGLDEAFHNGYEDCDFCLRARKAGYRVVYTPASTIYHHGQATPGRKDTDSDNWRLFQS
ncbi:glycosyltransferase family 2 protein, partial [bacterium]|nr:glycosyltransferase family 2 protein [bacterium]